MVRMRADHVIVTMATANQVAVMSMALTWWKATIGQLGGLGVRADRDEILRGAAYLISAWDPSTGAAGRLLLGVGDQLNINGVPELYSDFGSAVDALQVRGSHTVSAIASTSVCTDTSLCGSSPGEDDRYDYIQQYTHLTFFEAG